MSGYFNFMKVLYLTKFLYKGANYMYRLENEKEYALNNAVASVEMEGYVLSDDEKKLCLDVLNGKLTKEEFIQIMLERCKA